MLHLNEIQQLGLLIVACMFIALACWAVLLVIPNRNETIEFLNDRIRTLEYWINDRDKDIRTDPLPGTEARIQLLQRMNRAEMLNDELKEKLSQLETELIACRKKIQPDE